MVKERLQVWCMQLDYRRLVISGLAMDTSLPRVLLSITLAVLLPMASPDGLTKENIPHSRQKRILWITNDGRLALPPGTSLAITPSLSMPLVRHPPRGFLANMTTSFQFSIDFDKLGLTDNENPYGDLPPLLGRSMGSAAVNLMADYLGQYMARRRGKREVAIDPKMEEAALDRLHGGERLDSHEVRIFQDHTQNPSVQKRLAISLTTWTTAVLAVVTFTFRNIRDSMHGLGIQEVRNWRALMYGIAEDMLENYGISGKECLLRTICEVQAHPLSNFGFFGEVLKLFFTPSKSPYSSLLREYVDAQKAGESGGECWPYYRLCPKSLFQPASNKYSKDAENQHRRQEYDTNQIDENNNVEEVAM